MADGTIKIMIEADGNKAIKSAKDLDNIFGKLGKGGKTNGLTGDLDGVASHGEKARVSIKDLATSMGLVKVASVAFRVLKSSVGSAIDRFDTLNKYPVVMKALGYSANDVTKSVKTLGNGIEGLPTSLNEISASAQQLAPLTGGADSAAKSAVALNDAFLSSGASVSDASRGMQQYTQMLSTGKVDLMSWRTLQETMPIALRKTANAFGYTGKSAENDLFKALQGGKITIEQLNDKFVELDKGQNGFSELARKNSVGIKTSFTNLKTAVVKGLADTLKAIDSGLSTAGLPGMAAMLNSLKSVIANFFKEFNSAIAGIVPKIVSLVSTVSSLISGLTDIISTAFSNDMFKGLVVGILSGVAAFKTFATVTTIVTSVAAKVTALISVIKNVGAGISILFNAIKSGKEIVAAFNLVLGVNPFVLLGVAIAAVVAGLVYFFAQTESGKEIWANFTAFLTRTWQATVAVAQTIWTALAAFFSGLWTGITTFATAIWNGLVASLGGIWNGLVTYASGVFNLLKAVIMGPILLLIDLVTGNFGQMKSDAILIWNSIKAAAGQIWSGLSAMVSGIVSNFVSSVSGLFKMMAGIVVGIWNGLKAMVVGIARGITSGAINAWNGMVSGVRGIISSVSSIFNSLSHINLFSIGKHIVQGLIDGIGGMIGSVRNKISELASTVTGGIRKALKIHSPSRVMAQLGMYTGMGFSNGIEGMIPATQKMSEKLAKAAMITKSFGINSTFSGITAESASGVGRGVAPTNSVVNNYSNTATTTVQTAKESNDKVLEALNKIANNRPVAVVDGSSFAQAYEPYGSTETARRSQMKGRGLAVDSKF